MANKKATVKKSSRKAAPVSAASRQPRSAKTSSPYRAKVRMYRQGLGDCFLITLQRKSGAPFYMLIDCGVILGTANATQEITNVVQDILDTTQGHINVLAGTHEHWDHLSGFVQAHDLFKKLKVDQVWLGWTEDPQDELANQLRGENNALRITLSTAATRMGLAGEQDAAAEVTGMLEFFGAKGSGTTSDALNILKGLSSCVRFCRPTDAPVVPFPESATKIYVLGPPHDLKMIKKINPSKSDPETYGMTTAEPALSSFWKSAVESSDPEAPFDGRFEIPLEVAQQLPFFQEHYWGEDADSAHKDQTWRRIDGDWLQPSSELALALDSATNNTSLVLALELDNGDVLLFAADAQVGNWLSWQDLKWKVDGQEVTGPDLLHRTILYKVGHHGSHNATLRQDGLEMMSNLKVAMLPVDHAMALKKRWGQMPFDALLDRLDNLTKGFTLRIDQSVPAQFAGQVTATDLFYEITV
jgi:hypothetical protein